MRKRPKPLEWDEKQYQVYALVDPRDNTVRYVGKSGDVQKRYYEHIHVLGGGWEERKWIIELKELGLKPVLRVLETVEPDGTEYATVLEREEYWIRKLACEGAPLLNVSGVTRSYPQQSKFPQIVLTRNMTEFERLRINAGVTIVQLSKDADISRGTIEKIEKDLPVRAVLAARACNALSRYLQKPVTYEELHIKVIN